MFNSKCEMRAGILNLFCMPNGLTLLIHNKIPPIFQGCWVELKHDPGVVFKKNYKRPSKLKKATPSQDLVTAGELYYCVTDRLRCSHQGATFLFFFVRWVVPLQKHCVQYFPGGSLGSVDYLVLTARARCLIPDDKRAERRI